MEFGVPLAILAAIFAFFRARRTSAALARLIERIEAVEGPNSVRQTSIERLEKRLDQLERTLRGATAAPETVESFVPPEAAAPEPEPGVLAESAEAAEIAQEPATAPEPPPPAARPSIEERLGARWSVWIGGLALGLGALFLVRYSIEQGLIGPGIRILLGTLFAAFLLFAGEGLRRRDNPAPVVGLAAAHIPGVLTAAGTVASFGTVYAAHALYGFIGPGPAFVLMGLIGLATMLASALHGPALAGLGLVGAFAVPLLVSSSEPSVWPVVIYLAVVVASAYGLARLRNWGWLAGVAAGGALLWSALIIASIAEGSPAPEDLHIILQTLLALALLTPGDRLTDPPRQDRITNAILAGWAISAAAFVALRQAPDLPLTGIEAGLLLAASLWRPSLAPAALLAAAVLLAALGAWPPEGQAPPDAQFWDQLLTAPQDRASFIAGLTAGILGLAAAGAFGTAVPDRRGTLFIACLSGAGISGPLVILALGYARLADGLSSPAFAASAAGLGAVFVALLERLERQPPAAADLRRIIAKESYAAGAIAALALGLTLLLFRGWLTIALALAAWGAAYVTTRRPYRSLRGAVAVLAALVLVRLAIDPEIMGPDVGSWPILNWLLWGYGVPALAFGMAARHLDRSQRGDRIAAVAQALSVLLIGLLVFLEIRHALNGGHIDAENFGHLEAGLQSTAGLGMALVLSRLDLRRINPVFRYGSLILGTLSLTGAVLGLGLLANPAFDGTPILGGRLINSLAPAYLLPAAMAGLLARQTRSARPPWFVIGSGAVSLLLLFLYVSLEIRRLFHDTDYDMSYGLGAPENWAYSAAWLILGVAALIYGLLQHSVAARAGSAVLILASVTKVFLFDLSAMDGIWRALSFIGLGGVLIGIGLLYQTVIPHMIAKRS